MVCGFEASAIKMGRDSADDKAIKDSLDYQKSAAKLQEQNKAYKEFCEKNGLKTRAERTQIAKWDREQAAQARGAAKRYETYQKELDKYSKYYCNEDGAIKVTDDLKGKHVSIKSKYKPFAVVETRKESVGQIDRSFYDKEAKLIKQVHSGHHGDPEGHPYGKKGEHTHVFVWKDDKIVERLIREVDETDRKENKDIL